MQIRVVKQGDCFHNIATEHGFSWDALWNHGENAELRQLRKDPSVLLPGDEVHIPERTLRDQSRPTNARHRFRKRGTPAKVKIQVLRNDEPRANEPFKLTIDGKLQTGTTDGEGFLEMKIPPDAARGELHVGEGQNIEIFHFELGTVDPVDTESGARSRLRNMGYDAGQPLEDLLREFQGKEELQQNGQLDQATQDRLKERFGE